MRKRILLERLYFADIWYVVGLQVLLIGPTAEDLLQQASMAGPVVESDPLPGAAVREPEVAWCEQAVHHPCYASLSCLFPYLLCPSLLRVHGPGPLWWGVGVGSHLPSRGCRVNPPSLQRFRFAAAGVSAAHPELGDIFPFSARRLPAPSHPCGGSPFALIT